MFDNGFYCCGILIHHICKVIQTVFIFCKAPVRFHCVSHLLGSHAIAFLSLLPHKAALCLVAVQIFYDILISRFCESVAFVQRINACCGKGRKNLCGCTTVFFSAIQKSCILCHIFFHVFQSFVKRCFHFRIRIIVPVRSQRLQRHTCHINTAEFVICQSETAFLGLESKNVLNQLLSCPYCILWNICILTIQCNQSPYRGIGGIFADFHLQFIIIERLHQIDTVNICQIFSHSCQGNADSCHICGPKLCQPCF